MAGNYGDDGKAIKPHAGEAKLGAERPDGTPQKTDGHQPVKVAGESQHTPQLRPGQDANDKAKFTTANESAADKSTATSEPNARKSGE